MEDPHYSVNIKKGVVSLLQLNLNQEGQIEDVEPRIADIILKNKFSYDKNYDEAYRVMEVSVIYTATS